MKKGYRLGFNSGSSTFQKGTKQKRFKIEVAAAPHIRLNAAALGKKGQSPF